MPCPWSSVSSTLFLRVLEEVVDSHESFLVWVAGGGDVDPERELDATEGLLQISQIKISDAQAREMHISDAEVSFLTLSP